VSNHIASNRFRDIVVERGVGYDVVGWLREEKNAIFFWFRSWGERQ
jgi:hypothetical protein